MPEPHQREINLTRVRALCEVGDKTQPAGILLATKQAAAARLCSSSSAVATLRYLHVRAKPMVRRRQSPPAPRTTPNKRVASRRLGCPLDTVVERRRPRLLTPVRANNTA